VRVRMRRQRIWEDVNQIHTLASCRLDQFQSTLWAKTHSFRPGSLGLPSFPRLVVGSRQDQRTQEVTKATSPLILLFQPKRTPWHLACVMSGHHSEKGSRDERGWRGCHEEDSRNPSESCSGAIPGSNRSRGDGECGGSRQHLQCAANPQDGSRGSDIQAGTYNGVKHDTELRAPRSWALSRAGVTDHPGRTIHVVGSNASGWMKTDCNEWANADKGLSRLTIRNLYTSDRTR